MKTYQIIESVDKDEFSQKVNALLKEGWQLHGATQTFECGEHRAYIQPLVIEEKTIIQNVLPALLEYFIKTSNEFSTLDLLCDVTKIQNWTELQKILSQNAFFEVEPRWEKTIVRLNLKNVFAAINKPDWLK